MAESLADIKKGRKFRQRMLRFAGYYAIACSAHLYTQGAACRQRAGL